MEGGYWTVSTTIDERVVSMQFDNRNFEKNVSTTMSTLGKLKQSLKLDGASKGLNNINSAVGKVNMSGLGSAVETVSAKFSALQVMGVTALANITNSAVNAGKRIVKALTIDPITTGFKEYETQINATQTILANTSHKGSTIEDVNRALEELNKYADMTIYNFTEMTRNIGTFTAAGIDLDTSVTAIQGIANLAAVSGSTSQQASTAMYQLSQALAAGTIRLMDWNSVVNAGMGGEIFQNALKETSAALGTGAEAAIEASGSFRESLKNGWLTAEVLTETLKKFTTSGATEYVAEYTGLTIDAVAAEVERAKATGDSETALDRAAEALAKMSGKSKETIKETLKFAETATDAATKVKTFTQLWDVLKESAQSGWAQTWKIIIGDFEEAKSLLTPLADFLTGALNKFSDWRNAILDGALGKGFGKLSQQFQEFLTPATTAVKTLSSAVDTFEDLGNIVDEVILGKFGNGQERFEALTEAGINYYKVQNKVNEKLSNGFRYTEEQIAAQDDLLGIQKKTIEVTEEQAEVLTELDSSQKKSLISLCSLSDEQLRSKGLTEEQIAAVNELRKSAEKLGMPISEFIDNLDQINGRWLLIESFKNIGNAIVEVFNSMKQAWQDIFPPKSIEERSAQLFNLIAGLYKFSKSLLVSEENAEKFKRTFKGVFAILDIVRIIVSGPLKIALDAVTHILGLFGLNILDVTAFIGDLIVGFRDWIKSVYDFSAIIDPIVSGILTIVEAWDSWIDSLKDSENLPKDIAEGIASGFSIVYKVVKDFVKKIPEYLKSIPEMLSGLFSDGVFSDWAYYFEIAGQTIVELGKIILAKINEFLSAHGFEEISADAIQGLINGFVNKASEVWDAAVSMASGLVQAVKDFLGIHSPSTVFAAIGGFIVAGLVLGLQNGIPDSLGAFKDVIQPMLDWIQNLDFGAIVAGLVGIGTVKAAGTAANALDKMSTPFEGIGELLTNTAVMVKKVTKPVKDVIKGLAKIEKAVAFNIAMDGVKTLAMSLLMLVGAVAILTLCDTEKLWNAVGVVAVLAVVLAALSFAMSKIGTASATFNLKDGLNIQGITMSLVGIGIAIALMAASVKMIGNLNADQMKQGFLGLAGAVVAIGAVLGAFYLFSRGFSEIDFTEIGKACLGIGASLVLMAIAVKMAGNLEDSQLIQAGKFVAGFVVFVGLLATIGALGGKSIEGMGKMMLSLSVSLLLMVGVVKLAAGLTEAELIAGGNFLLGFVVFIGILATIGAMGGKAIDGVGKMMLGLSVSLLLMVAAVKIIGTMSAGELVKGLAVVTIFTIIIAQLVKSVMKYQGEAPKVALTILAFSVAIGVLAAVAIVCGMISVAGLVKGVLAVGVLSLMMGLLITATRGATNVTGTIIAITVAIGLLVAAVAVLSTIDPGKLAIATAAISILMGVFALVIKAASTANKATGVVIAMSIAIAAIGTVLYLLGGLPVQSVIASAASLAGLLVVMTGVLYLLAPIGGIASSAIKGVIALTTMALPLLAFVGILALMSNVNNAINNAIALSLLASALSIMLIPLALVGVLAVEAIIGVIALTTMAVPLLAFVGILALMSGIQNGIANAEALTELMTAIGDVLFKVSLVAPLAVVGVAAINSMVNLMTVLGVMAVAIGALTTYFPNIQVFLNKGISIFEELASGLGSIIGSFIAGFAGAVLSILPMFGIALSGFMVGLMPFIAGTKMIDASVLEGVGILSAAILILTAASVISGLASLGGLSLVSLGTQLSNFIIAALPFIATAAMITPNMTTGVKALAETILILTAADILQGLSSLLGGGASLESFATQLPKLGEGLNKFSSSLGEFSESQLDTVNCAAQAIKTLAQASNEIPNAGGLLGQLVGENDLGTFASQFPVLGTGLRGFLDNVGEFTDTQVSTINSAAEAIKTLAQAANEIPNSGGWISKFVGDNNLGAFAEQFPALGTGLRGFLDETGTLDSSATTTVTAGADAVAALAKAASSIPNEGGWISKLIGDNNLGTFADNFPKLGEGLAGFVSNIGTFNDSQTSSVNAAITAIEAISDLANTDLSNATMYLPSFGELLSYFGTDIGTFCANMPSSSDVDTAVSSINSILDAVDSIGNANSGVLSTFADNLKSISKNAVTKFIESFTSSTAQTDIKSAASTLAQKAVDGAEGKYSSMKSAGKYLVDGFAAGITERTWYAVAKAKEMAKAAIDAAKEKLGVESPSKVFKAIGGFVAEGFALGIDKMSYMASDSTVGMANTAIDTMKSSISRISDAINSDIDAQPTIRPVLDLSDIRSGASAISGMFGSGTLGVNANVSAVSSMMNSRGQNGTTNDVISAINKLRDDLGNVGNTTYTINGVTYDDGSNITEAVRTITRAAVMERRV